MGAPTALDKGSSFFQPKAVVSADRGRDFDKTGEVLENWLSRQMPAAGKLRVSSLTYPLGAGVSNETILFDAVWEEGGEQVEQSFVARLAPGGFQLFLDPAFSKQIVLIRALRAAGLPTPNIRWVEDDPSILGEPFFVMEKVTGRVPVTHPVYNLTGWLHDASVAQRRHAWEDAMRWFGKIHNVPVEDYTFLRRDDYAGDDFAREIAYWKAAYDWAMDGRRAASLDALWNWLEANLPTSYEIGLVWGDARIGNMIFGDDFSVAAILDWEQHSLAGGLHDLAWWLTTDDIFSRGIGVERLEGLGTREETIALWQELTGRSVEHLLWHEVFACVRGALLVARQVHLRKNPSPGMNSNNNLFVRRANELLGWNAPADDLES